MEREKEEIEITDEMIEAGIKALERWDFCDLSEWKVFDIYREMERAHRRVMAIQKPEKALLAAEQIGRQLSYSNK